MSRRRRAYTQLNWCCLCSAQVYYLPGLRAEKEITRSRMVQYIEHVFGEKMSAHERNRLLPRPEEDDEMVEGE